MGLERGQPSISENDKRSHVVPAAKKLLEGKRFAIMGLANEKSIAWGVIQQLIEHGATLMLTYPNETLKRRVIPLAESVGVTFTAHCDVADMRSIEQTFDRIGHEWGTMDGLLHAIAFSDKDELKGRYVDTSRENFLQTMDISCYSFTAFARHAASLMPHGGSLLSLTYYGAEKVMPHYNVMGVAKAALESSIRYLASDLGSQAIRVNAISAGPIKTLASSAIGDFRYILKWNEYNAPLKRNVTIEEVGGAALFLFSDLATAVTGEVLHVDCGYHVVGMKAADAPDIAVVMAQDGARE